jgi:type I restriction enzyme S subunit
MRCFVVSSDTINGRLDPQYLIALAELRRSRSKYPSVPLADLLVEKPQYGANESAVDGNPKTDTRYIRITDIDGLGNLTNDWKTAKTIDDRYLLKEGDLLFARSGATAGKSFIYQKGHPKAIFAGYLIRFRIDPTKADPRFVFYYTQLQPYALWVKATQRPSGQPNINSEEFKALRIPLPPLSVQRRIVEIMEAAYARKQQHEEETGRLLDSVDAYVAVQLGIGPSLAEARRCFVMLSTEIKNRLDPLFYSRDTFSFLKASPHKTKTIEDIAVSLRTGFAAGRSNQELEGGGVLQIRPTNIDEDGVLKLNADRSVYVKNEGLRSRDDDLLKKGEVLFNNTNSQELVGKTAVLTSEERLCCSNHVTRIAVDHHQVIPEYLWVVLNLYQRRRVFFNICTNWNNQSGVNADLLRTVMLPIPSLPIQARIVEEVTKRFFEAKQLRTEALQLVEQAAREVETLFLSE